MTFEQIEIYKHCNYDGLRVETERTVLTVKSMC